MAFLRNKRNPKTGAIYQYWQGSKRVPGKKHPISLHLGKSGGNCRAAMLLNEENMTANQQALAEGKFVTEANLGGKENAPASGEGDASK